MLKDIKRVRIKPVGKGIIDQEARNDQQPWVSRVLDAIALQRSEVIGVTEFGTELFEQRPITVGSIKTNFALKVKFEVGNDVVVVQQCVVHVEQEDDLAGGIGIRWRHTQRV